MNPNGIRFYSALIDELIKHGIHPVATLYHWDLPLPLQMENDGWLSHKTANAFVAYARVCFERFGDRRTTFWTELVERKVKYPERAHESSQHGQNSRTIAT